ncbi:uncharacterized protein LOC141910969 [Tubulanus polymorphus]|uniref:uncharacterized protein LOC141910969 n=1 Tax=Tubulanus polymorphus TaxID=672921 RepID=UPI003DA53E8A
MSSCKRLLGVFLVIVISVSGIGGHQLRKKQSSYFNGISEIKSRKIIDKLRELMANNELARHREATPVDSISNDKTDLPDLKVIGSETAEKREPKFNPSGWRRKRSLGDYSAGLSRSASLYDLRRLIENLRKKFNVERRGEPNFTASGWRRKRSLATGFMALKGHIRHQRELLAKRAKPKFRGSGW